ncbi:MAG TPA: IPT/TIG domain-containing protein [Acidimicrobiales bacterium]
MAALFLGAALGAASLTMAPAAQAAPAHHASVSAAAVAAPAKATTKPDTVVTRLSATKGVAGNTVLIKGTKLATANDDPDTADETPWIGKAVKFGETAVATNKVTALSESTLVVEVPANANGQYVVTVGDATKGPKFTYAAPVTISTDQDDLDALAATMVSETGLADGTIDGTNFTKATKVVVGGKAAKINKEGGFTATKLTFAYPAGLLGVQDVVVVDSGVTYYVGYVTYHGKPVTVTGATGTSYVEQASAVELTGTNLDLVTSVTYDGVKASFKKPAKGTTDKLTVTIPKGEAKADGALVVTTKYEATASYEIDRVAAPVPTVSAVTTVTPATAGEVTLTGTGLTGLKKVVVKNVTTGKLYAGSKISVTSSTSAKVTLPALPAGDYTLQVFAISATGSTAHEFTVGSSTPSTPAPTLTAVSYDAAADPDPAVLTLEGTNLAVGQKVRYYTGSDASTATVVTITGAGSATLASVDLASDLAAGTYHVQVSGDDGTTWSTASDVTVS